MTEEQWNSLFSYAGTLKATYGPTSLANQVVGRAITYIVDRLVKFWGRHKATLIPVLTQTAIAALEAIVAAKPDIDAVNPPGVQ